MRSLFMRSSFMRSSFIRSLFRWNPSCRCALQPYRVAWSVGMLLLLVLLSGAAHALPKLEFNRDIRPILSENCLPCHGPDKNRRQADLRLDLVESARERRAIVPGKPDQSGVVTRIFATDARQMPPVSFHKTLSAAQKNLIKRWIAEGAEYQAHWAYLPPVSAPVPATKPLPASPLSKLPTFVIRNPIDAFILQKLTAKQIAPSPESDPRTLLRRVTLDLTGLPPTPQEVSDFLADRARHSDAYERVVDRLLGSPHYGERMAVPWLDLVRYADTVGFHGDQNQNAWAYRDYVIDSFNRNKPFDQFTIEQLAGDLLPNPTPEQRIATCFNRLNMVTREGGAQPKEYLAKYAADRVRTVSMTWLGATFGCAECHNHKYDPITQKDFYSLSAFFSDVRQWGVYSDYGYTPNPDLRGFTNDYPFPPEITVESRYLQTRIANLRSRIDALALQSQTLLNTNAERLTAFADWRRSGLDFLNHHPDGWQILTSSDARITTTPTVVTGRGAKSKVGAITIPAVPGQVPTVVPSTRSDAESFANLNLQPQPDGSLLVTGEPTGTATLSLHPESGQVAALRLEALTDASHDNSIFRTGAKSATLMLTLQLNHPTGAPEPVAFRYAGADVATPEYTNGYDRIGVQRGWKLGPEHGREAHTSVWLLDHPIRIVPGDTLRVSLPNLNLGRLRISSSPFVPDSLDAPTIDPSLARSLAGYDRLKVGVERTTVLKQHLYSTAWTPTLYAQVKALDAEIAACRGGKTPVMVTEAMNPLVARVLPRGNWQDESGEVVTPAMPHFLPGYEVPKDRRLTRLDLARWIVSPDNPLTARVFVNRMWRQLLGTGLSAQVEDLGAQGEWPTHPELLDWLAIQFQDKQAPGKPLQGEKGTSTGWNIKSLVRLIVTSSTYRQKASLRPELREIDPNNRLLASQNPRRLEAEFVRDNALAIAGLLNTDIGGPSCKPYQPAGYYVNIQFPNRDYSSDTDDGQYRRGVYMHWQRTFLHPMLANFDAPSREDCLAARTVANTPQQALTLLNDPTFVEAARAFAIQLLSLKGADDSARLDSAFQRALSRAPKAKERQSLLAFLDRMRKAYKERPEDAKQLLTVGMIPSPAPLDPLEFAAWINVCRVVLNLNETITRY